MKVLIFSVILVTVRAITSPLVGQRETENISPETSHSLEVLIGELDKYRETIDDKFESLQKTCQRLVTERNEITISTDEEKKLEKKMAEFEDKMLRFSNATTERIGKEISEALENTLKKLDVKLLPIQSEIASLKSKITNMVTKEDIERLENDLITIGTDATEMFKGEMSRLLTKEDMLDHHNELQSKLKEMSSTPDYETRCEDSSKLEEILGKLINSDSLLKEVFEYLKNDSRNSYCSSTMGDLTELIENLDDDMENNSQLVVALETVVQTMQKNFLDKLENLHIVEREDNKTARSDEEAQVPSLPSSPERLNQVDCSDSNFIGAGRSLNVCQTAVRFQKCHLEFVAFHCCQSCQKAGLLSSLPHYTGPRTVPVLQALKSMRPFA